MASYDSFEYKMSLIGAEMSKAAVEMGKKMDVMLVEFKKKVTEAEANLKK